MGRDEDANERTGMGRGVDPHPPPAPGQLVCRVLLLLGSSCGLADRGPAIAQQKPLLRLRRRIVPLRRLCPAWLVLTPVAIRSPPLRICAVHLAPPPVWWRHLTIVFLLFFRRPLTI